MNELDSGIPYRGSQIIIYRGENNQNRVQVRVEGETVWLTQVGMAELYQTTVPNINIHIKNIIEDGEISEEATIKEYLIVRSEGRVRFRELLSITTST